MTNGSELVVGAAMALLLLAPRRPDVRMRIIGGEGAQQDRRPWIVCPTTVTLAHSQGSATEGGRRHVAAGRMSSIGGDVMDTLKTGRLLFELCLPLESATEALAAIVRAPRQAPWAALCRLADAVGVMPLLRHCLEGRELLQALPESLQTRLDAASEIQHRHNAVRLACLRQVLTETAARGYRVAVVKETALVGPVYKDMSVRYLHDLDLLTEAGQVDEIEAFVRETLGYDDCDFHGEMRGDPALAPLPFPHAEELEAGMREASVAGVDAWMPSHEHNLIWLCWHDCSHGWSLFARLLDVLWYIEAYGQDLDWAKVLITAKAWGVAPALYPSLLIAREMAGAAVPKRILTAVVHSPRVDSYLRCLIDVDMWLRPLHKRRTQQWWRVVRGTLFARDQLADPGNGRGASRPGSRPAATPSYSQLVNSATGVCQARWRLLWRSATSQGLSGVMRGCLS